MNLYEDRFWILTGVVLGLSLAWLFPFPFEVLW